MLLLVDESSYYHFSGHVCEISNGKANTEVLLDSGVCCKFSTFYHSVNIICYIALSRLVLQFKLNQFGY